MRIDEVPSRDLMSFNLKNWKSVKQIQKFLQDRGYRRLGAGAFAEAWKSKSGDKIVKISTNEDMCWLNYVKWIQNQRPSRHLPKVHSFRTYDVKEYGQELTLFVAVLEVLQEIEPYYLKLHKSIPQTTDMRDIAYYAWLTEIGYTNWRSDAGRRIAKNPYVQKTKGLKNMKPAELADYFHSRAQRTLLVQLARRAQHQIKGDCVPDLHMGNVMYRESDNSIVITDPVATALSRQK
jgi:hypothetical protein